MTSLEEAGLAQSLANEVTCPLCSSLFRDPVRLDCEHNYCRQCILDYWREGGGERERGMEGLRGGKGRAEGGFTCPLCREIFPQFTLKANKLLAKIVERMSGLGLQYRKPTAEGGTDTSSNSRSLLRSSSLSEPEGEREGGGGGEGRRDGGGGGGGGECSLHREPLKVYCVEEGVAICVVCAVSREHKTHSLAPIEEILTHWEESFEGAIRGFEQQKEILETLRREKEKQITELKDQAASLRAGLVSDIDRLLQFLEGEKGALCTRLDTDLARLLAQREGTLLAASQEVTRLQQEVTSLRGQLGQEVRNAPVLIKALQDMTQRLKVGLGARGDDITEHLDLGLYGGPTQLRVWKRMRGVIQPAPCPLTFDPATANQFLSLSDDLTAVRYSHAPREEEQQGKRRKGRGFGEEDTGEEEEEEDADWQEEGAGSEGELTNGDARFEFSPCLLALQSFTSGRHYWEVDVGDQADWDVGVAADTAERAGWVVLTPESGFWTVGNRACRRVGMYLDMEAGQLTFYSADDMVPLHSYLGQSFSQRTLLPFFYPSAHSCALPLTLLHTAPCWT